MKTLLLMRHAKSSWRDADLPDHERPLNGRGRKAAPAMGEMLAENGLLPDLVVTSTALRALETAKAVMASCNYEGSMEITRRLYLADPAAHLEVLSDLPPGKQRVLLIGHNPGISEFLGLLTGDSREMPTASIAWLELPLIEFADVTAQTRGRLVQFFRPSREEKRGRS